MSESNFTPQPGPDQPAGSYPQGTGAPVPPAYPAEPPAYPTGTPAYPGEAPGYAGYAQPGYPAAPQKTSILAILALIFGIVFAPAGIVLGHIALRQLKTSGEGGASLAKAGLIIGYIFFALWILLNIVGVLLGIAGAASDLSY
ncbi:DUF4190 domain-containing protein [Mycetocola sp. JXN-3]|uniref:DUF4190 domain-containing protein n=1 Tax=Mycetocola sp. JXN-3 TaxID=2116510 RepID=UPI00165D2EDB|nr:DUF4190 domain-containing protein [Mycetocola sp. JXN-3]